MMTLTLFDIIWIALVTRLWFGIHEAIVFYIMEYDERRSNRR